MDPTLLLLALAGIAPDPEPRATPRVSVTAVARARIVSAARVDFSQPPERPTGDVIPAPRRQTRGDGRIEIAFE